MPRSRELTHLLPLLIFSRVGFFKAPLTNLGLRNNDLDAGAKELVRGAVKEGMKLEL
jgi:hypothetical protein